MQIKNRKNTQFQENFIDSSFIMYELIEPILEIVCSKIIKTGTVPKHVAFVADGARRFGKKHNIPVQENHEIGLFGVMWKVIDWCVEFGIREYSILMYSFGNYHRPKDEVQHWIVVLKIWLYKCIMNWKIFQKKGIRFNFYGKLELIPEEINALMGILNLITRKNSNVIVNMAMGYTGKHEMSTVAFHLYEAVQAGFINEEHIKEELFQECLFAIETRPVDLLIRTSGYKRISDFLSWQVANGIVYFSDVLWPEFSRMQFLKALFYYQMNTRIAPLQSIKFEYQAADFLQESKNKKRLYLLKYSYDFGLLPTLDSSKIYTYDYEILYEFFLTKYKLKM